MEWDRLISDYLDDALTPQEVAALFQWIGNHPDNAKRFAQAAFLHHCLHQRLSAMRLLGQTPSLTDADHHEPSGTEANPLQTPEPGSVVHPVRSQSYSNWRRWCGIAAALLLIVGILAFFTWPRRSPARLLAAENATWGSDLVPPKVGDNLPQGDWFLDTGFIKLGFDNGNQLIIEGPARFAITDDLAVTLNRGSLTAVVTKSGRGLRVTTFTAQVTDLGTEFGVQASLNKTRVAVFKGKVVVDQNATGANPMELSQGSAVEVSTSGVNAVAFDDSTFTRTLPSHDRPLDLIDLLAGGDGTGSAAGVGINAATGQVHETKAAAIRLGNRQYVRVKNDRVLDGCFIPGGRMPVDSAGHKYTFPSTSLVSYGLIWGGPNVPWEGELLIATTLPEDSDIPTSRVLVMHSNNGLTFNLDAIRALDAAGTITGFRARVGNSYRSARPGSKPAKALASIHVIVDGTARFENLSFANVDPPIDVTCALSDNDHFLTLATTDGGDGNACDWVLWTHPEFLTQSHGQ